MLLYSYNLLNKTCNYKIKQLKISKIKYSYNKIIKHVKFFNQLKIKEG